MKHKGHSRRAILRGIGGTAMGLPLLDLFSGPARAAGPAGDFSIFNIHCNGVMQLHGGRGEPEMFWPRTPGLLTAAGMAADLAAKRSTGELSAHAERLMILKGIAAP